MSIPQPVNGRLSLVHNYRNLSEREIRARLESPLGDAERVTAKAELLRRGAGSDAVDTTFATGFAPTSAFDIEGDAAGAGAKAGAAGRGRAWPWLVGGGVVLLLVMGAAWATHSKLVDIAWSR